MTHYNVSHFGNLEASKQNEQVVYKQYKMNSIQFELDYFLIHITVIMAVYYIPANGTDLYGAKCAHTCIFFAEE